MRREEQWNLPMVYAYPLMVGGVSGEGERRSARRWTALPKMTLTSKRNNAEISERR